MEDECLCSGVNWEFYQHQEGFEEVKHAVLQTTLEVEATIVSAKEEITRRESELLEVNEALSRAMKERDESIAQWQKLEMEILQLQAQQHKSSSSISSEHNEEDEKKKKNKVLPEKGKLLKAVIEAGPLLQTLLMAGAPLPQWQHPPPLLHFIHIPPPLPFFFFSCSLFPALKLNTKSSTNNII